MKTMGELLRVVIRLYRWTLSPLLPPSCRYLPSCSEYASEAIARFGPWRGGWLALKRLGRCHPWGGSGYDPVLEPTEKEATTRQISNPSS